MVISLPQKVRPIKLVFSLSLVCFVVSCSITNYTKDLHPDEVKSQLSQALNLWARDTKLHFTYVQPSSNVISPEDEADIVVSFHKGYHGDGYPFDGEGAILAHAFFPGTGRGGDAHFDDEEKWRPIDAEGRGMSLFAVAAHEFGHSLGLSHSSIDTALMYPWFKGFSYRQPLPNDDKYGIQQLYGKKDGDDEFAPIPWGGGDKSKPAPPVAPSTPAPMSPEVPNIPKSMPTLPPGKPDPCDTTYDAVAVIREELYIFKGPVSIIITEL
jgi:hypothetical protein